MPAGPRKPVKRHNGRVYRPTRDVALGFLDFFHAPGRILGTQTFRAAILSTQIVRAMLMKIDGGDLEEHDKFH